MHITRACSRQGAGLLDELAAAEEADVTSNMARLQSWTLLSQPSHEMATLGRGLLEMGMRGRALPSLALGALTGADDTNP